MTKMKYDNQSVQDAHSRIDHLEPRVKNAEDWIENRDRNTEKIKNWFIGAVMIMAVDTFGLVDFLKKIVL